MISQVDQQNRALEAATITLYYFMALCLPTGKTREMFNLHFVAKPDVPHANHCVSQTEVLNSKLTFTVQILCIGTHRSQQTVQTKIRLLLKKQSDQGLRCLPFHQHLLDALMQCYIKLFYF